MLYPVCDNYDKDMKKTNTAQVRVEVKAPARKTGVRPEVKKLIEQKLKAHAPTWEALAKR